MHILIPLIVIGLIRDYCIKNKKKFSLHYVLIAAIAGVLPDLDIALFWFMNLFVKETAWYAVHRTFTHSIFFVGSFLTIGIATLKVNIGKLRKHKLNLGMIFIMIAVGFSSHLLLDWLLQSTIALLWPLTTQRFGLNLLGFLPENFQSNMLAALEGLLLILWLIYLELKHKISDFI